MSCPSALLCSSGKPSPFDFLYTVRIAKRCKLLKKTNLIPDTPINALKPLAQQGLKRNMINHQTLGLENLGLERPAAPRNAGRAKKRSGKCRNDEPFLQPELQYATPQLIPSIGSSRDSPMLPSCQSLSILPLGASADIGNHWPSQDYRPPIAQNARAIPRHSPLQISVSPLDQPNVSRYYQGYGPILSNVPNVTEGLLVQPKLSARDPGSMIQRSTLSALMYRNIPVCYVDKQSRYSTASTPLTDPTPSRRRRPTCSPAANIRKAISQPTRSSRSIDTDELEITPSPARKPSPSVTDSKDHHIRPPIPTSTYLNNAHAIPNIIHSPQRLLLVLDLNGTLLHRSRASQNYIPRPCLHEFLQYAFANHSLLVWSSAQPFNVKGICARLFSQDQREMLLGEWGRDTLGLTSTQYKERVQVYKRLDSIWDNENLQRLHPGSELGEKWGQHNTVLIDDSVLKATAQPFNHVKVPEFVRGGSEKEGRGRNVLGQVVGYLEEARKWSDISGFVRRRPFAIDEDWRWQAEEAAALTRLAG